MLHEDDRGIGETINKALQVVGKHKMRVHLTFDEGQSWHWYEIMFSVGNHNIRRRRQLGLLICIDEVVAEEEKLVAAQRQASEVELKESFLANISHDLRTPLGAVTGFSQLLTSEEMPPTAEERKEYNDIIKQNSEMMLNMIDGVLEDSRIRVGDVKLKQLPVEAGRLVRECYNTNKILTPSHLELRMQPGPSELCINIDIHSTKEVVNNFVSNAFKFTPSGSITIGWTYLRKTDEVEVFVEDTGIGVSEEAREHLFTRFYKVDEQDKGTGLGLSLCQTIVERQGGTIGVTSKPGEGSRFYFRMKAVRKEERS